METAIHARFPYYEPDRSTFSGASELVEIDCSLHDYRFQARPFVVAKHGWSGCPGCLAASRGKKRSTERRHSDAEHYLRRIADELSGFYVETYPPESFHKNPKVKHYLSILWREQTAMCAEIARVECPFNPLRGYQALSGAS